ncbi:hypothetical protein [Arcticibacter eurypsychrophilus]|uniref:hypothetical protein n=1 Tax=Arcticibacter eurypsychrophilus TaxID=1434752 RepID=UPI00084D07B3|nr:hypothetical protein [Arcticibacter eurypsychrophilus]
MKHLTIIALIFITRLSYGQNYKALNEYQNNIIIPAGKAMFYGNFVQRLGLSSGDFPQEIRLINDDTMEIFTFNVKPTFKTAKENTFSYIISPGNYTILHYWWIQSKWYGAKFFTEPIYKGNGSKEILADKLRFEELNESDLDKYEFTITANSLNYLGTWHFDTEIVSFTDDKVNFDNKIKDKFKSLDLLKALTVLPD